MQASRWCAESHLPHTERLCLLEFIDSLAHHMGRLMKTRIEKWGNSLPLRIPKSFAVVTGLAEDAIVDLSLEEGKLIVTPAIRQAVNLEELLNGVNEENLHSEVDTGSPTSAW
jgi:antitoxin MazE